MYDYYSCGELAPYKNLGCTENLSASAIIYKSAVLITTKDLVLLIVE